MRRSGACAVVAFDIGNSNPSETVGPERIRLSSSAFPVDIERMRGTLSQRLSTPESLRTGVAGIALGALVLSGMGGLVGCDRNTEFQEGHASSKRGELANIDSGTEDDIPFEWPSDPSHPVLEFKISSPVASGSILIELMPELAPGSVVHVIELAEDGFYDGTTFHRVIPDFMLQGGDPNSRDRDPTNDGAGQPGRPIRDEFSKAPFLRGVVGMGNKGRQNSTSTQFFIMQADNSGLDGRYNTVGRVLDGLDLVDQLAAIKTDRTGRWGPKDRPIENIIIESVRPIGQVGAILAAMELEADPAKIALANTGIVHADSLKGGRLGSSKAGSNSANAPASLGGTDRERIEAEAR